MKIKFIDSKELDNENINNTPDEKDLLRALLMQQERLEENSGIPELRAILIRGYAFPIVISRGEGTHHSIIGSLRNGKEAVTKNAPPWKKIALNALFAFLEKAIKLTHVYNVIYVNDWMFLNVEPTISINDYLEDIGCFLSKQYPDFIILARNAHKESFDRRCGWKIFPSKRTYIYKPQNPNKHIRKKNRRVRKLKYRYGFEHKQLEPSIKNSMRAVNFILDCNKKYHIYNLGLEASTILELMKAEQLLFFQISDDTGIHAMYYSLKFNRTIFSQFSGIKNSSIYLAMMDLTRLDVRLVEGYVLNFGGASQDYKNDIESTEYINYVSYLSNKNFGKDITANILIYLWRALF